MLCLLVGKQSTYFTVSPVTGAGVTRRYWILVAGALGSWRLSPAWHSCGLLGGAPLLPGCTLQGGQPGVKLVANSRASSGRRRPQSPPTIGPCLRLHPAMLPSSREVFPLVHEGPVFPPREKRVFSSQRESLSFPWKSTVQEVFSEV